MPDFVSVPTEPLAALALWIARLSVFSESASDSFKGFNQDDFEGFEAKSLSRLGCISTFLWGAVSSTWRGDRSGHATRGFFCIEGREDGP